MGEKIGSRKIYLTEVFMTNWKNILQLFNTFHELIIEKLLSISRLLQRVCTHPQEQ